MLGEPSDICTDCGASAQDVRHLFASNKHQTVTTDLAMANNNNSATAVPILINEVQNASVFVIFLRALIVRHFVHLGKSSQALLF